MIARSVFCLGWLLIASCHGASDGPGDGSNDTVDATPDGPPDPGFGCADGIREGFSDIVMFPAIAACSGAWIIPGLDAAPRPDPGCQTSGNDAQTSGVACSAANLCAPSWHVCADAAEVAARLPMGQTCASGITADDFFAADQPSVGSGLCGDTGANDLFGCGGLGKVATASCAPLDVSSGNNCDSIGTGWSCGGSDTEERTMVIKPQIIGGGVLCCKTM